jgi:hypothetical protein
MLADRWHCKPWEVDDAPAREVRIALRLMQIEAACTPPPGKDR